MNKIIFISFEGTDGVGKSTQVKLLTDYLQNLGKEVVLTHEPGGTNIGEEITKIVKFYNGKEKIDQLTELLLFYASRQQLIEQVIRPALKRNAIVITDRFYDSSYVYQGYARGIELQHIEKLNQLIVKDMHPTITFLLNSEQNTLHRARQKTSQITKKNDRFEKENDDFFQQVREGFLILAANNPERIKLINSDQPIEDVFAQIKVLINELI